MIVRVLRVIENKIATKNCFNQKPPKPPSFAYSRDSQNVLNTQHVGRVYIRFSSTIQFWESSRHFDLSLDPRSKFINMMNSLLDVDMPLMVEKGVRGEICYVIHQ